MTGSELKLQYFTEIAQDAFPANEIVVVRNQHKFLNAYQQNEKEWYGTRINYPTDAVSFVVRFPEDKPCKGAAIYQTISNSVPAKLPGEKPYISDDGLVLSWVRSNVKPGEGYAVRWQW